MPSGSSGALHHHNYDDVDDDEFICLSKGYIFCGHNLLGCFTPRGLREGRGVCIFLFSSRKRFSAIIHLEHDELVSCICGKTP